jgi:hypothetical protein
VFLVQFVLCTLAVVCLVRWYLLPALDKLSCWKQLELLMLPFLIRFVGTSTLVEGVVGPEYSPACARIASVLDPLNFFLALAAIVALRAHSRWAVPVLILFLVEVVVFSVLLAWVDGPTGPIRGLQAHWYVGTIVVPILTVFQFLVLFRLIKHHKELRASAT